MDEESLRAQAYAIAQVLAAQAGNAPEEPPPPASYHAALQHEEPEANIGEDAPPSAGQDRAAFEVAQQDAGDATNMYFDESLAVDTSVAPEADATIASMAGPGGEQHADYAGVTDAATRKKRGSSKAANGEGGKRRRKDNDPNAPPKQTRSKRDAYARVSCEPCRKKKSRCILPPHIEAVEDITEPLEGSDRCTRCVKLNLNCVMRATQKQKEMAAHQRQQHHHLPSEPQNASAIQSGSHSAASSSAFGLDQNGDSSIYHESGNGGDPTAPKHYDGSQQLAVGNAINARPNMAKSSSTRSTIEEGCVSGITDEYGAALTQDAASMRLLAMLAVSSQEVTSVAPTSAPAHGTDATFAFDPSLENLQQNLFEAAAGVQAGDETNQPGDEQQPQQNDASRQFSGQEHLQFEQEHQAQPHQEQVTEAEAVHTETV
ncbi:hypothetical protein K437DRAFT_256218 [Tilletiaria anomala UBC 951]|uniref:Zn(2)-C6 fungal-type domain-containing protein n=1 Tax=Tilletiaria anomala (strain ATCC 24038 / CBS 436.72 / UBC 951) TaxID=1037660 RepID=A0A066W141_TILAU|nr:uncharacterized protein K437DRAFT_256218 [Tilletiaria anomala UBC 951]KDN46258.1 hypothetical protein K437DRAFT_256218 [Tilletiaria anomala UBC 951]